MQRFLIFIAVVCTGCDRHEAVALDIAGGTTTSMSVPTLDFGDVWIGDAPELTTRWRNDTGRSVHVDSVHVECPCLRVHAPNSEVEPGGEIEIRVDLDTSAQKSGEIIRRGHLLVEPGKIMVDLAARARMWQLPRAAPPAVCGEADRHTHSFVLETVIELPLRCSDVGMSASANYDMLKLEMGAPIDMGSVRKVPLTIRGSLGAEDDRSFQVSVEARGLPLPVERRTFAIPCRVTARVGLTVSPRRLVLDDKSDGADVFVHSADGVASRDLHWTVNPIGALELDYDPTKSTLHVKSGRNGARSAEIRIETADGDAARIQVSLPSGNAGPGG